MPGIRIKHTTLTSTCYLVPVMGKPYVRYGRPVPMLCPLCQVLHPVKTVHLWLEPDGTVIVSPGVLDELRLAGMPDLEVVNEVQAPPPLRLGNPVSVPKFTAYQEAAVKARRGWRQQQDKQNRRINLWWNNKGT